MVLLVRAAGLRLLGLFLFFCACILISCPRRLVPPSLRWLAVVVGNGILRITGGVSVWEPGLWAGFGLHLCVAQGSLPSFPGMCVSCRLKTDRAAVASLEAPGGVMFACLENPGAQR